MICFPRVGRPQRLESAALEGMVNGGDYETKIRKGRGIAIAGRDVRMEWKRMQRWVHSVGRAINTRARPPNADKPHHIANERSPHT